MGQEVDGTPRVIARGIVAWRNDQGVLCWLHHHSAHPGRGEEWAQREARRYPGGRTGAKWRREQDMDQYARAGAPIWKGFLETRNMVNEEALVIEPQWRAGRTTGWFHVIGLDVGPHAAVFLANRPGPMWEHPTKGFLPILTDGQWVAYSELYDEGVWEPDPEIVQPMTTDQFRLAIYREAVMYMGLPDFSTPLQGHGERQSRYVTDIFIDPSAKQIRNDLSAHATMPLRLSIGSPGLDERLNNRQRGHDLVNELWLLQRDCCGIRYYGQPAPCEVCHETGPAIPGYVVSTRCVNYLREIRIAKKPKPKFKDETTSDTKAERKVPQHASDAGRYGLMGGTTVIPRQREEERRELLHQERDPSAYEDGAIAFALAEHVAPPDPRELPYPEITMEAGDPDA